MIRSMVYSIKQAFKQVFRNHTMTVASVFSITAMLLILGLFFILVVNINMVSESAKQQFDTISVYLNDEVDEAGTQTLINEFQRMEQVSTVTFVPSGQALNIMRGRWGEKASLLDGYDEYDNPFPNGLQITVAKLEDAEYVVAKAKASEQVEDVLYYDSFAETLLTITNYIQVGAAVIIGFLIFVSVVVVSNTVKLTVLAREREISIMKYVGATNWFIRGPFLTEGIIIGCISAGVSVGLIYFLYSKVVELFSLQALLILKSALVPVEFLIWNLVAIFMALGVSIGAFGSLVSMRRFLDT